MLQPPLPNVSNCLLYCAVAQRPHPPEVQILIYNQLEKIILKDHQFRHRQYETLRYLQGWKTEASALNSHSAIMPPDGDSCGFQKTYSPIGKQPRS